jgi:hypothetical protein
LNNFYWSICRFTGSLSAPSKPLLKPSGHFLNLFSDIVSFTSRTTILFFFFIVFISLLKFATCSLIDIPFYCNYLDLFIIAINNEGYNNFEVLVSTPRSFLEYRPHFLGSLHV